MQYRARRHARINGHDYAPGEIIRDPGAIRNTRTLIAARYIEQVADAPDPEPESEVKPLPEWKRDDLIDLAVRAGIDDPDKIGNRGEIADAIHQAVDEETLEALISGDLERVVADDDADEGED